MRGHPRRLRPRLSVGVNEALVHNDCGLLLSRTHGARPPQWCVSELATVIGVLRPHPMSPPAPAGGPEDALSEPRTQRREKRFLTASQKFEIWLQLVWQEATVAEVAATHRVDRTTINRIKQVAKDGALLALAASKPGVKAGRRENGRLGLSGRVPRRVDAATKAGLLDLINDAVDGGWTIRRASRTLDIDEVRVVAGISPC